MAMRVLNTRRGKMAFITLDNAVHRVEVSLFSEKYTEYYDKLQKDQVLTVVGEMSADEFTGGCQMRAEHIFTVEELRTECLVCLELRLDPARLESNGIRVLKPLLAENTGGKVVVRISYTCANGETGLLDLGQDWRIRVDTDLLDKLVDVFGEENLFFHYSQEALAKYYPAKPSYRQRAAAFG